MLFALLMTCMASLIHAQQRTITGTVMDEQGAALPNVSYVLKGTTTGGATNDEGYFSITIPNNKVILEFSAVGYISKSVTAGSETSLTVVLQKEETAGMQEVVVTALGIKKDRRSLGYATSTVAGEDLLKAGATQNPFLALYGKAAGVGINIGSGGPAGGVNVRIRGAAGLESNTNTRPLFVVDGVPMYDQKSSMEERGYDPLNSFDYGSGINDINSEDIESIEILKGAKATVLYGSQALNGVVLITTKSGRGTRGLGIQVSHQVTVDKPFTFIDFQNEYGSGESVRDLRYATINGNNVRTLPRSRYSFGPRFDNSPIMLYDSTMSTYHAYPDNFIDFFQTALSNRTNIAIAGGGEMGSVRGSYTRNTYEDVLPGFNQKQNTFSFNGNFKVSPLATFEFINNLYTINTQNRRPNIGQWVASGLNRDYDYNWMKSFYKDGEGYKKDLEPLGFTGLFWPGKVSDILWQQNDNNNTDKKLHLVSSVRTTLQFTKWLSLIGQAALDYTNTDYITQNKIVRMTPVRIGGKYAWTKDNTTVQNYQGLLKFEKDIAQDVNLFVYGGGAYQKINANKMYASTGEMGLIYPDWFSLENADIRYWPSAGARSKVSGLERGSESLYSVLGSATFSYKGTYYIEAQARNDWNSTLRAPNNSYFYPGLSATWNFSENLTLPELKFGKLRLSWADVGGGPSTATGSRYFASNAFRVNQLPYPSGPTIVTPPAYLLLDEIKPFRKREYEIGFNTRWFEKSRLEVDFSFYSNNVYNQIITNPLSAATGYPDGAKINTGNTKNWGYELFVKAAPVATDNYRWDLTFTAANQRSKIVKLYPGITEKQVDGNSGFQVYAQEGKPIGEIRAYDYQKDPNGNRIVNANGFYQLTDKVQNTGKNVNPRVFGGLYSDFSFKGFNFHAGIDYKFGGTIFSYTNNYLMGTGAIKASLPGRDESQGGLAYYIDDVSGAKVLWEHNKPAPSQAKDGIVYSDGMILEGVKAIVQGGQTSYVKNDVIISAPSYYQTFINDLSTSWPPDRLFKNDYVKIRELSIQYTIPKSIVEKARLQKVMLTLSARNLGYLYKTVPNIDPEGALGAQSYIEYSFFPSVRSYAFGVTVSF